MSRSELESFKPEKLKPGGTKLIETVNPETHYHEVHYFYRDDDGELFSGVTHGFRNARTEISKWKMLKHSKPSKLKQMQFDLVQPGTAPAEQENIREQE